MDDEEIENAQMNVMIRSLDAWFLFNPVLTRDAVTIWLESLSEGCQCEAHAETITLEGDARELG